MNEKELVEFLKEHMTLNIEDASPRFHYGEDYEISIQIDDEKICSNTIHIKDEI